MGVRICIWASGKRGESLKGVRRMPFDSMLSALVLAVLAVVPPAAALTSVVGLLVSQLANSAKVRVVLHSSQKGRFMEVGIKKGGERFYSEISFRRAAYG
ncbi:hypothetical protein GCM10027511_11650 [Hymenobacter humi]